MQFRMIYLVIFLTMGSLNQVRAKSSPPLPRRASRALPSRISTPVLRGPTRVLLAPIAVGSINSATSSPKPATPSLPATGPKAPTAPKAPAAPKATEPSSPPTGPKAPTAPVLPFGYAAGNEFINNVSSVTTANTNINMNTNNFFSPGTMLSGINFGNININIAPNVTSSGPVFNEQKIK